METIFGLLFWVVIAYFVWRLFRKKKTREFTFPANTVSKTPASKTPAPEPLNSDIMTKLEQIEKRIEKVEVDLKNIEQKVSNIPNWFWLFFIGGLIGWFWNDIIAIIKSFFLVG